MRVVTQIVRIDDAKGIFIVSQLFLKKDGDHDSIPRCLKIAHGNEKASENLSAFTESATSCLNLNSSTVSVLTNLPIDNSFPIHDTVNSCHPILRTPQFSLESPNLQWLEICLKAAIKEYKSVWMTAPRWVESVGLSRFHAEGIGMPPETESSHFNAILAPFARKHHLDLPEFIQRYNAGTILEPDLDAYFVHDRSVRESGHDTTYRLEGKCANICTVDLNAMLFKYEMDIGNAVKSHFHDSLAGESSAAWFSRADRRIQLMNEYCWNEEAGMFFDYDIQLKKQNPYESVTTFIPMWAGLASPVQAKRIVYVAVV